MRESRVGADPSVWEAIAADPTVPIDPRTLDLIVADQRRWSRMWLYPWVRVVSRVAVMAVLVATRLLPGKLRAHAAMDALCVWFLRRFVCVEACELLIRHFVVETRLLQFIARNSGIAGIREVTLLPTSLPELGNGAVVDHDVNVYDVLISFKRQAAGSSESAGRSSAGPLDSSMLTVPALDPEPGRRRWLNLDIQTALCLMNIPFAVCLTAEEYRRAIHSMRLDASLLTLLSELTGDPRFLAWQAPGLPVRVDSTLDASSAVYHHAVICEFAFARLVTASAVLTPPPPPLS